MSEAEVKSPFRPWYFCYPRRQPYREIIAPVTDVPTRMTLKVNDVLTLLGKRCTEPYQIVSIVMSPDSYITINAQ